MIVRHDLGSGADAIRCAWVYGQRETSAGKVKEGEMPRYVVERTFPDGLPISGAEAAEVCLAVVERNADEGVTWVHSYVSEDRQKTFCVYERRARKRFERLRFAMSFRSTASRRSEFSIRTSTADERRPPRRGRLRLHARSRSRGRSALPD